MADYPEKLGRLLELFAAIPDRGDRIQMLIDTADRWRPVPESIARRPYAEQHKTPACESEVYVFSEALPDGTLKFHFAVENPQGISARAMAVILAETLSGAPPQEVARISSDMVYQLFGNELSMGKSMGLMGMVSMVLNSTKSYLKRQGN